MLKPEMPIHYASPPHHIGATDWRVIVTDSIFGGRRFAYQFQKPGELPIWNDMAAWPGFAFEIAGMGLPLALAQLYEAHAGNIHDALDPTLSVARLLSA